MALEASSSTFEERKAYLDVVARELEPGVGPASLELARDLRAFKAAFLLVLLYIW
jgi:hypothetical protein